MYVVTFYSFKGGVGRTMALVNVAVELALAGKRVLIVDFDLEAPGLETFDLPSPRRNTPGVVDYVAAYVRERKAPDFGAHVYEAAGVGEGGGRLWVMPAGRPDQGYAAMLASIDWPKLYSEQEGFLMMEDLKAQWKKLLDPDYVLLDSRTGHSDIAGICTRQLPDAVVALFFPNDQNLAGLARIVEDVRAETKSPRKRTIYLHFVASNVPDLDDEHLILDKRLRDFSGALKYTALSATIHHYNTLSLVNQEIFTRSRRRTRLASEYRGLTDTIVRSNPQDREGVLHFLQDVYGSLPTSGPNDTTPSPEVMKQKLEDIAFAHPNDGDILFRLGQVLEEQGRFEEALNAYERARAAGLGAADVLLRSARLYESRRAPQQAIERLSSVLNLSTATYFELTKAVERLRDLEPAALDALPASEALLAQALANRIQLAYRIMTTRTLLSVAEAILRGVFDSPSATPQEREFAHRYLSLSLIGMGRFEQAMRLNWPARPNPANLGDIAMTFNYAMAEWGLQGVPPKDLFQRVVSLTATRVIESVRQDPNFAQCIGLAYCVLEDLENTLKWLAVAETSATTGPVLGQIFSGWRYLQVSQPDFQADLAAIRRRVSGEDLVPPFISETRPSR